MAERLCEREGKHRPALASTLSRVQEEQVTARENIVVLELLPKLSSKREWVSKGQEARQAQIQNSKKGNSKNDNT